MSITSPILAPIRPSDIAAIPDSQPNRSSYKNHTRLAPRHRPENETPKSESVEPENLVYSVPCSLETSPKPGDLAAATALVEPLGRAVRAGRERTNARPPPEPSSHQTTTGNSRYQTPEGRSLSNTPHGRLPRPTISSAKALAASAFKTTQRRKTGKSVFDVDTEIESSQDLPQQPPVKRLRTSRETKSQPGSRFLVNGAGRDGTNVTPTTAEVQNRGNDQTQGLSRSLESASEDADAGSNGIDVAGTSATTRGQSKEGSITSRPSLQEESSAVRNTRRLHTPQPGANETQALEKQSMPSRSPEQATRTTRSESSSDILARRNGSTVELEDVNTNASTSAEPTATRPNGKVSKERPTVKGDMAISAENAASGLSNGQVTRMTRAKAKEETVREASEKSRKRGEALSRSTQKEREVVEKLTGGITAPSPKRTSSTSLIPGVASRLSASSHRSASAASQEAPSRTTPPIRKPKPVELFSTARRSVSFADEQQASPITTEDKDSNTSSKNKPKSKKLTERPSSEPAQSDGQKSPRTKRREFLLSLTSAKSIASAGREASDDTKQAPPKAATLPPKKAEVKWKQVASEKRTPTPSSAEEDSNQESSTSASDEEQEQDDDSGDEDADVVSATEKRGKSPEVITTSASPSRPSEPAMEATRFTKRASSQAKDADRDVVDDSSKRSNAGERDRSTSVASTVSVTTIDWRRPSQEATPPDKRSNSAITDASHPVKCPRQINTPDASIDVRNVSRSPAQEVESSEENEGSDSESSSEDGDDREGSANEKETSRHAGSMEAQETNDQEGKSDQDEDEDSDKDMDEGEREDQDMAEDVQISGDKDEGDESEGNDESSSEEATSTRESGSPKPSKDPSQDIRESSTKSRSNGSESSDESSASEDESDSGSDDEAGLPTPKSASKDRSEESRVSTGDEAARQLQRENTQSIEIRNSSQTAEKASNPTLYSSQSLVKTPATACTPTIVSSRYLPLSEMRQKAFVHMAVNHPNNPSYKMPLNRRSVQPKPLTFDADSETESSESSDDDLDSKTPSGKGLSARKSSGRKTGFDQLIRRKS